MDYVTESNHVLPTDAPRRARPAEWADFVRVTTVQRVTRSGLGRIGTGGAARARAEGLTAHARSIDIRLGTRGGMTRS